MKTETPRPIRGTQDMLGDQARRFEHVVDTFNRVRKLYGFGRVEVPVFEPTAVFARSLGETTDVVSKEMYTFPDKSDRSLTLRPEFTAGICRAYLTNGWQQHAPLKVATHGPVFRYEQPQAGRFRQFHQLDAEVIGAAEPAADVELLAMADQLLHELGVADGVTLKLNTLGDSETREAWRQALVAHFEAARGDLSEESRERLGKNPLRILDSKDPRDRPIADAAPEIDAHMSREAGEFFEKVKKGLQAAGVAFERDPRLVRGLDYYRHTAFEFVTDRLGAQGTVLGGGRYDGLIESLGGPHTPAVGWAAGTERLAMLVAEPAATFPLVTVVVEDDDLLELGVRITAALRRAAVRTELLSSGSVKKRFDRAVKSGAISVLAVNAYMLQEGDIANVRLRDAQAGSALDRGAKEKIYEVLRTLFDIQADPVSFVIGHEGRLRQLAA